MNKSRQEQIHEAAWEDLETYQGDDSFTILWKRGAQWADSNPEDKWISVETALPEVGKAQTVWIIRDLNWSPTSGFYGQCYIGGNGLWIHFSSGRQVEPEYTVTHWQPLPSPPKQNQ